MSARLRRIPWGGAGFVLGLASLFISLGGPAWAASVIDGHRLKNGSVTNAKLGRNSVTTTKIRTGAVWSSDVHDGSLILNDLSAGLRSQFGIKDGAVTTNKLADNAVTGAKVANSSLGGADIATDSIGSSDLAANSVRASELAANSVGTSELAPNAVASENVVNGAISATKLAPHSVTGSSLDASGRVSLQFPSIAANACSNLGVVAPAGANLLNDAIVATPDPAYGFNVSFSVEAESSQTFAIKVCNPTGGAIDPDGGAGSNWTWVAIGR
ncbi:MAG: hypothetical protein QOE08_1259 [Thermoleophilaceae bacterium]|jgi:hypothetical protein|nr:hypothetical protein [Thermoleophilaceae bacterium]